MSSPSSTTTSSSAGTIATNSACKDAATQFALCMEKTPCVQKGETIVNCIQQGDIGVCEGLRKGYMECRRSQLDMRTRIRGRRFHDTDKN